MIVYAVIMSIVAVVAVLAHSQASYEVDQLKRKLDRERKMRIVAEAALDVVAEMCDEQYAINRYRVSEAARAIHKTPVGGRPN